MLLSTRMGHRLIALVPLLLLVSCEGAAPADTFELSGRVSELSGGFEASSIEGATVSFISDTLIVSEATTDGAGTYRMRVTTDHLFGQVRAAAPGYVTTERAVYFDTPQRRVDLELRAEPAGG